MLRGAQTPGELKQRTERLHPIAELDGIQAALERLIDRELVRRLERRPGEREVRYLERLTEDGDDTPGPVAAPTATPAATPAPYSEAPTFTGPPADLVPPSPPHPAPETHRIDALERDLAELRTELAEVRAILSELRDNLGG
jgi:uncharacterized protein YceH (UPF0502 family)